MDIREWRGDDRPAQDEPVASLLRAAAAPSEPGPQPGEEAALAAFRATHQTFGRTPMRSTRMKAAFAAAVSAGVLLTGGIAAAATGTLPDVAQSVFGHAKAAAGASNANANADSSGDSTDQTTGSDETTDPSAPATSDEQANEDAQGTEDSTSTDGTEPQDETSDSTDQPMPGDHTAAPHPGNHGAAVSQVAKDGTTGRPHGEEVSSTARNNAGQAKSGSTDTKPAPGTERSDTGAAASSDKGATASSAKGGNSQHSRSTDAGQAGAQAKAQAGAQAGGR